MATNYADSVNALYLAYYGRPADPAGLAFWTETLQQSNGDVSVIASAFATSPEATDRFGGESVTERVTDIYQQLFNRAPDKTGLDYWTGVIQSGQLSMADAAISIMGGAQVSDAQISTAREQAAAQFTSAVAASGVSYEGATAIEAARLLISAVTADTKPADITALVQAGTSLVQTAHDNPAIIMALADGGDLSALLSTTSGKADPVGMVQALATLGKAALTDSSGLSALLHGGGVAGLLDSLPAGTSLQDVASAVQAGGLSAGAGVAASPVDTAPAITPTIAFSSIDGKDLPAGTTLVVNSVWYFVDVHGMPNGATADFQVSHTGNASDWTSVPDDQTLPDGTYYIRYVVKDTAGNSGVSNALKLVMDHTVAYPTVQLAQDTGTLSTDYISSNGAVKISGLHANEAWTYSFDGKSWTAGTTDANGDGAISNNGASGDLTLQIRTLENVNGNSQFTSTAFHYTVDTTAPAQGLKLAAVQGAAAGSTHSDLTHADITFSYTGTLDANHGEALFYRINSNDWSSADSTIIDTVNKTITFKDVDLSHGDVPIFLEAKDTAGNVQDLNVTISGPASATLPAVPTVALVEDTGASATDGITSNAQFKVSGIETGATWDYSFDGSNWIGGVAPDADGSAFGDLAQGEQTLQVRVHDAAGNTSTASLHATVDFTAPAAGLTFDHIDGEAPGSTTATHAQADVVFSYTGTVDAGDTIEYETAADNQWTALDSAALDANAKTITIHGLDMSASDPYVQVRVTDLAGNANFNHVSIDGPYTPYSVLQPITEAGLQVINNQGQPAHIYLTDGDNPSVQVESSDASGDAVPFAPVTIGIQAAAVQGVLGLGTGPDGHTSNDTTTYGFGSTGGDTLTGQYVWGYDGDDSLTVTGSAAYNSGYVVGGAGSDTIHTETSSSQLVYTGVQDSFIAADDTTAHGFDTVYVSTDTSASFTEQFKFDNLPISGGYPAVTATGYTGTETGNELLTKLNAALGNTITVNGTVQEGFVDFGAGGDGKDVGFLVIDADADGAIGAGDYVIKIVGNVDHSTIVSSPDMIQFNAGPAGN